VCGNHNKAGASPNAGDGLSTAVKAEWATPNASVANDGETLESWLARRERVKLTAANGNGFGVQLTQQVKLESWSTPRVEGFDAGGGKGRSLAQEAKDCSGGLPDPASLNTNGKPREWSGVLNPDWVLQLQGYPEGWLDIEPQNLKLWETQ
jgi:hypothetical protein